MLGFMSERDKVAAWAVTIAVLVGVLLWLSTQPPSPANGPCVQQGHDLVCE
jgi:hypothetical protein